MIRPGCHQLLAGVVAHDTPGPTEADVIRYFGVAIAFAGAAISEAVSGLSSVQQELTRRIEASERRAARVDGRGIWVIGSGIVLTGIPDVLADVRAIGIVAMAFAGLIMVWAARRSYLTGARPSARQCPDNGRSRR